MADEVRLFRYSALTFDAHDINLDRPRLGNSLTLRAEDKDGWTSVAAQPGLGA